jgi:hypothetical protein
MEPFFVFKESKPTSTVATLSTYSLRRFLPKVCPSKGHLFIHQTLLNSSENQSLRKRSLTAIKPLGSLLNQNQAVSVPALRKTH